MKEVIKQFVDMMEDQYDLDKDCLKESPKNDYTGGLCRRSDSIVHSRQFIALKPLANAPVTDEGKKVEKELISDGWIEKQALNSLILPISDNTPFEILTADGRIVRRHHPGFIWAAMDNEDMICAYRIISYPEEKKEPKRQTFEEWAIRNAPNGNIDLLSPGEVIHLWSEWEQLKNNLE